MTHSSFIHTSLEPNLATAHNGASTHREATVSATSNSVILTGQKSQLPTAFLALAQRWQVSPPILLTAIWAAVWHRYSHQLQFTLALHLNATRQQSLPIVLDAATNLKQLVKQINAAIAMPVNAADQLQLASIETGETLHPLRPAGFGMSHGDPAAVEVTTEIPTEITYITLHIRPTDNEHSLPQWEFHYNAQDFDRTTIERLAQHYQMLLDQAIHQPEMPLTQLAILPPTEQTQLLNSWNQTALAYDRRPVYQQFTEQAARTPEAIALIDRDAQITYAELNRRANQLAHALRRRGVTANMRVGLSLERSIAMVVGLLGILKAGGAYVPMDPGYPSDRIALMLEDSQAPILVSEAALTDGLAIEKATIICLDRDAAEIQAESTVDPTPISGSDDLAYILYTSGSTGKPKGVMISQGAFTNFIAAMAQQPGMQATDTMLALTSISFDISGLELFLPLTIGAKLVIAPRGLAADGKALAALVEQHDINIMQATPTGWRLLLESGWPGKHPLQIWVGGEALLNSLAQALLPRCDQLWNLYGPTETTVWSTAHWVQPEDLARSSISIGRPIANTALYILDSHQQPVPIGVTGELYIGGDGVALGYLDRPELTAARFLPDPFSPQLQARMYRTGDLVRYRADGQVEYLERMDNQVKIRGYRIELGEIEAALEQAGSVQQAVVIAREDEPGNKRLVAYLVPTGQTAIDPADLRSHLRQSLPEYMVPSAFVTLAQMPLTPSGKTDRQALPKPDTAVRDTATIATTDPIECALLELWQSLLQLQNIDIRDNFFDLGGQSLLAVRLADQLSDRFNQTITPAHIFQAPTIAAMAQYLRGESATTVLPAMMVIQAGQPEQRSPLFALHVLGERGNFFRPLTAYLDPEQPVYGLAAQMLGADAPKNQVPTLAAYYVEQIRTIQPQGPYYLVGMSFGGTVTYEVARQLQVQGETIAFVGLFDTAGPAGRQGRTIGGKRRTKAKIHWQNLSQDGWPYLREKLRNVKQRHKLRWELRWHHWQGKTLSYELHYQQLLQENDQALARYAHPNYDGHLVLFRATEEVFYDAAYLAAGLGWRSRVKQLTIHDVPGNHTSVTDEPHVQVLAKFMQPYLPHPSAPTHPQASPQASHQTSHQASRS